MRFVLIVPTMRQRNFSGKWEAVQLKVYLRHYSSNSNAGKHATPADTSRHNKPLLRSHAQKR